MERLGDVDRLLAGHGIDDQQCLGGLHRGRKIRDLFHQRRVDGQAAGGVEDDRVADLLSSGIEAAPGDGQDVRSGRGAIDGDVERFAERLELVGRGRPIRVGGHEQRSASLFVEMPSELRGGGGLTRALQTDEHDNRRVSGQPEGSIAGRKQRDQLLVDDLHDLLAGRQALEDLGPHGSFTDPGDEVLDDLEVDVGLEQSQPHLSHGRIDVGGANPAVARKGAEGLAQPIAQGVEHGRLGFSLIRPAAPTAGAALGRGFWRLRRFASVPHRAHSGQSASVA